MKLYKILIEHCAPRDRIVAVAGYLYAENDRDVYFYVDKHLNYDAWEDRHDEAIENEEPFYIYDDDYNEIGAETYRERLIRLRGSMNDENSSYDDAYYGVTHYGWEELDSDLTAISNELFKAGITFNTGLENSK